MKYVIDISENRLDVLRMFYKDCQDNLSTSDIAIVEGKPLDEVLDEIRTEIEEYKSTIDNAISEDELKIEGMKEAFEDCLYVIDKYKAESEVRNDKI